MLAPPFHLENPGSTTVKLRHFTLIPAGVPSSTVEPGDLLNPDELHKCGGTMLQNSGKIIATTRATCGAGGSGGGSLTWKIKVADGHVVHLRFQVFNMDMNNRGTWVKVSADSELDLRLS